MPLEHSRPIEIRGEDAAKLAKHVHVLTRKTREVKRLTGEIAVSVDEVRRILRLDGDMTGRPTAPPLIP